MNKQGDINMKKIRMILDIAITIMFIILMIKEKYLEDI
jgi:hypothetical protein